LIVTSQMIRKIVNTVLVLVLLITTTGVTYHYHYCGNTLMKFSVFHTPKPCCEHPENCCRDRSEHFQLKNDYLFSIELPDLAVSGIDLPLLPMSIQLLIQVTEILPVKPDESPPPLLNLRLALLQQYLI
jgi:hypothetical protein